MASSHSEQVEALRISVERLCQIAATQDVEKLSVERQAIERALEDLTTEADNLRLERDDARTEASRAEFHLTATRELLEEGPDGYLITNNAGIITHANRAAQRMLGVALRFLVRKPLALFIEDTDLRIFRWRVNNARSRTQSEWPTRMRARGGASFTAGLTVSAFPSDNQNGDLRWFMRDITVRQRAEELVAAQDFTNRMLESEQLARAAAETAQLRVELLASVSSVLAASLDYPTALSRVAGLVVPAVADVVLIDLVVEQKLEQAAMSCVDASAAECLRTRRSPDPAGDHPIARVIRTGEAALHEVSTSWLEQWASLREERDLWETLRLTSIVVVPIKSHRQTHGALTFGFGPSGRHHDATDLGALKDIGLRTALALDTVRLFTALEAEQHHRDEFLAMLAHELRNPLGAVTNGLEALARANPSDRTRLLQILSRQSRHLARLLNDLLDVSGVRFGRLILQQRRLDVRTLAQDSLEELRAAGKTVGAPVRLCTDPQPVVVLGDADRLMQAIANLLDNAIKYTPPEGSIELSVGAEGDDAVLRVRDTGAGIAPEFLPRIFDVFSRAPGDPGQSHPGLGLGLSVVRDLIVKHGGTVTATSAGVGQGSEFVIRLPLDRSQELPSSAAESSPVAERSILIVEDNPDAAEALRMVLELKGHHVTIARDGRRAIEQMRSHPPNVALVDIGLPDIDGCEVGRTVRAQPGGESVYLVAVSGYSAPADRDRALQAGFNSYLIKPVAPDALLEVIGQAPHRQEQSSS